MKNERWLIPLLLALVAGALLASVAGKPVPAPADSPADFGLASCFDPVPDGDLVHLLFGRPAPGEGGGLEFFYTRTANAGSHWSQPVRVPVEHAPPGRHQRGHDPRLAVAGDRLLALWTAQGDGPWGSGPLAAAISEDGGQSWAAAPAPTTGPTSGPTGYRFPAVTADQDGFHAIWIHAVDNERSLRHSRFDFDRGDWSVPEVIDPQICACCWNTLAVDDRGNLLAVYRDQNPSDMALAVSQDRGRSWRRIGAVGAFNWDFQGCPHVGAGLALGLRPDGSPLLLASVWTGHPELGGAYLLRSLDFGESWNTSPIPGKVPWGNINTDLALLGNQKAAAVWDAPAGEGARTIFLATSPDAGITWSHARPLSDPASFGTHPRVVATGDRFLVFWTGKNEGGASTLLMEVVQAPDTTSG